MKFWSILITAKITNVSITTRFRVLILTKKHSSFLLLVRITIKMKKIQNLSITLITAEKDKCHVAFNKVITHGTCSNKVIAHSIGKINQTVSNVYIASDGWAAQFRLRFGFNFLKFFQIDLSLKWNYKNPRHGKGPMGGIGGINKNLVYRKVLSGDLVIDTPKKFAEFANKISNVDCFFLLQEQLLKKPEEGYSFVNKFCYLSEDLEPFLLEILVYNVDTKQRISLTATFASIVKINMSRMKNGFNALSALSGNMKSPSMNRSPTLASSYFI